MKYAKYLLLGIFFGIVLTKSEVISWYRIYEMFRFQSFHMYGVIGSTVFIGILGVVWIKRSRLRTIGGDTFQFHLKEPGIARYLLGGTTFGLGWALTGACPGPLFILVGNGFTVFIVAIASAIAGTYVYGMVRNKLPH